MAALAPHELYGLTCARRQARRGFAYNIYDEAPRQVARHKGTSREVAEAIFQQHSACGSNLQPGATFHSACRSLAKEYPELSALPDLAMEGRLHELMDDSGNGIVYLDDFLAGVEQLLNPTSAKYKNLRARLQAGYAAGGGSDVSHVRRVAIVGSGVAGLQTARALAKLGKDCVIFERTDNVGGVWRSNYADFGLQVPKELYEFPEYHWPSDVKNGYFPSGPETQKYIESYAAHFGLDKMIRFNTGVYNIMSKGGGGSGRGWKLKFGRRGEPERIEEFDFVVVATGMYGWPPHIPSVRGRGDFKGDILHSCAFTDSCQAHGRNVVVIGGGKSAIGNCVVGGQVGKSSTLVYRTAHWPVPRYLCGFVPFKWGTHSRFGHFMLPTHYDVSPLAWYLHCLAAPAKWAWWRAVELMFRAQFRLPREMLPSTPIESDVFTGGQILDYHFRDMLRDGKVQAIKGSLESFAPSGVVLQDGTELEADVVIFGTGFTKNYGLFDRLIQTRLDLERDGLYLYRNMIPPRLGDIAFVGSEVSTFNNILTHGLQAEWLARMLAGKLDLPTRGAMVQAIEREQAWKRTWMPGTSARASIFQLHMMKYHDRLLKDMGESHRRKGANILGEMFAPYSARDYASIFAERAADRPPSRAGRKFLRLVTA